MTVYWGDTERWYSHCITGNDILPGRPENNQELQLLYPLMDDNTSTRAMPGTDESITRLNFKDDGKIPNSKFPLLLYKQAFSDRGHAGAAWLERTFASNNWTNSWRNGIYSFHHYHSTSHEVLGVYSGEALVHLGGEQGEKVTVRVGDIIIIPAGVGHKNLGSKNLGVVGAYPDGRSWDLMKGLPGERPAADENIAALPIPTNDPLFGPGGGLLEEWL